jgi:hypothetical protein
MKKVKGIHNQVERDRSLETILRTILKNWPTYLSDAYNKIKVHKNAVVDLEAT